MRAIEGFLLSIILFSLIFHHGKQRETEATVKNKDIQINRLANEVCRSITNPEVKAECVKQRIKWSNPE